MLRDDARLDESIAVAADVSRRTVTRGMAWSVPVIVTAVAAPMRTGSTTPPPPTVSFGAVSGVVDGAGKIDFTLPVSASAAGQIQFLQLDNGAATGLPTTLAFAAGGSVLTLSVTKSAATAGTMTLTYQVVGSTTPAQVSVPVSSAVPTLTFGTVNGLLDYTTGSIAFTLAVSSSGPGKIKFEKLDNAVATGLPTELSLTMGANTLKFNVTKPGSGPGSVSLSYTIDGGKTTQVLTVPVSYPSVGLTNVTGVFNRDSSKITFSMTATSSGPGPITFTKWDGDAQAMDVTKQLVAGPQTVTISVSRGGLAAVQKALSWKIGNGPEQQPQTVDVKGYLGIAVSGTGSKRNFQLSFNGPTTSSVVVTSVASGQAAWTFSPTTAQSIGTGKIVSIDASRAGQPPATATITFTQDGATDSTGSISV